MRPLALLGLPLVVLGWVALHLSGGAWPLRLSVELLPRPVVQAPAPQAATLLKAEVTATYPHLEGLALGDAVQFDRYGVVPPTVGSVHCVAAPPDPREMQITPIGGRLTYAGSMALTLVPAGAPGCAAARLAPILPRDP